MTTSPPSPHHSGAHAGPTHGHPGAHGHAHGHGHDARHEADLADLLDLDDEILGAWLDDVTHWLARHAPALPRRIVDLGAGTGTGSRALARRFPSAEVMAVDRSATMLDRVLTTASLEGLADRVHPIHGDLDTAWPEVGDVDVAWASSSLHEVADPDRVLRDVHRALRPGGLLVVVEMDAPPRFLPDDAGVGRPGLERRLQEAGARAGWNAHPDWSDHLARAGFEVLERRTFATEATGATEATEATGATGATRATEATEATGATTTSEAPSRTGRYAHANLLRTRSSLGDRLAPDDLAALDRLLADHGPDAVLHRRDLRVRGSRTAWAARRP